jgi:RsiW-degrading membrane proteinase PrsW (M82 family)
MNEIIPVFAAAAGGLLPALAWLWFWLREDSANPEPRALIALAFLAGMISVAIAVPLELGIKQALEAGLLGASFAAPAIVYSVWSALEEIIKYVLAYATVLRRREDDEPIDPAIYMVTTALGFAGAENVLFLLSPLSGTTLAQKGQNLPLATLIQRRQRFVQQHQWRTLGQGARQGGPVRRCEKSRPSAGFPVGVLDPSGLRSHEINGRERQGRQRRPQGPVFGLRVGAQFQHAT